MTLKNWVPFAVPLMLLFSCLGCGDDLFSGTPVGSDSDITVDSATENTGADTNTEAIDTETVNDTVAVISTEESTDSDTAQQSTDSDTVQQSTDSDTVQQSTDSDTVQDADGICQKPAVVPPGTAITDPATAGSGVCSGATMGSVLEQIYADEENFTDISIYDEGVGRVGDGSYVYPFITDAGGFAFAIKLGWGDCPSGCINNAWFYFETDDTCKGVQTGEYSAIYNSSENCPRVTGLAMWNLPRAMDPARACDSDNAPQDISGTHIIHAKGAMSPCGDAPAEEQLDMLLTVIIEQNPADLSMGTVTVKGFNHRLLNAPLAATFSRRRFTILDEYSNLPSACPDEYRVSMAYDFECYGSHTLSITENGQCGGTTCCDFCKGYVSLSLGE